MPRVMVVDDEAIIAMQLEERLAAMGYEVVGTATSGEDAIEMARHLSPDIVLMDIVMPGKLDGIAASKTIKAELDIPVIFLTAYTDDQFVMRAKAAEPYGYIVKPFQEREIKATVEVALHKKEVDRQCEERYRSLFEDANDAIFIIDTKTGTILEANRQTQKIIGRTMEEIVGMHQSRLYPPHRAEYYENKFRRYVKKGRTFDLEAEVITKDGSIVPVFISASMISLGRKEVIQGLFRDITQEKRVLGLKEELASRKLVEKAKGILISRHRMTEKEAMRRLQRESRRQRKKIKEIAQAIISSELLLN